jgi:hypothetical protein
MFDKRIIIAGILFALILSIGMATAQETICPWDTPSTAPGPCGITWSIKDTVAGTAKGNVFVSGVSVWQNTNNASASLQAQTFDMLASAGNIEYARSATVEGQPDIVTSTSSTAAQITPGMALLNGRMTGMTGWYSDIVRTLPELAAGENATDACLSCELVAGRNTFDMVTNGMVGHDLIMSTDMSTAPFPLDIRFEGAQSLAPGSTLGTGLGTMRAEGYVSFITGGSPAVPILDEGGNVTGYAQGEPVVHATYQYASDTFLIGVDQGAQQFSYHSTRT